MRFPKSSKEKFITLWGGKVNDYKTMKTTNEGSKWEWKSIENLDMDPTVKEVFGKIIHKRKIKQVDRKDNLIWEASKEGKYSVIEGYRAIINSQRWEEVNIPLNLCWDSTCLPKVGFFLWLAFQKRILTADRL